MSRSGAWIVYSRSLASARSSPSTSDICSISFSSLLPPAASPTFRGFFLYLSVHRVAAVQPLRSHSGRSRPSARRSSSACGVATSMGICRCLVILSCSRRTSHCRLPQLRAQAAAPRHHEVPRSFRASLATSRSRARSRRQTIFMRRSSPSRSGVVWRRISVSLKDTSSNTTSRCLLTIVSNVDKGRPMCPCGIFFFLHLPAFIYFLLVVLGPCLVHVLCCSRGGG